MPYADPARRQAYSRESQRRRREAGLCVNCSRKALPDLTRCAECRADHAARNAMRGTPPTRTQAGRGAVRLPGGTPAATREIILDPNAEPGAVRLNALVKADKKFRQTWYKNRRDLQDQSPPSYTLALADIAVHAGWPDQEVVNLMICWRRIHNFDLKLRERYYELTLARAREPIRMESEQRKLEETLTQPPEDEEEVLRDSLAILLGVDINRVVKYLGDPPVYYMDTDQGGITIGTVDKIYSQTKFREAVGAATNVVVPKVSEPAWEKRIQAILLLCEEVDVGDASHPAQETRTWIMDYLIERYIRSEDEWEEAVQRLVPFLMDGLIRIFLEDFSKWLEANRNRNLDSHALGRRMRQVSARPDKVNVYVGGGRTTRSVWVLTDEFRPPQRDLDEPRDGNEAGPDGGETKDESRDESRDGTEENGG